MSSHPSRHFSEDFSRYVAATPAAILQHLRAFSRSQQIPLYLVGGLVRDICLSELPAETPQRDRLAGGLDIDILSELPFEQILSLLESSDAWPYRLLKQNEFSHFLTGKAEFALAEENECFSIDFSTARSETYSGVAATPEIQPASVEEDLLRRDFTANAIALELSGGGLHTPDIAGIDALEDLRKKELRVLHEESFKDDPARLLRALRFTSRLGFSLAEDTAGLFDAAVSEELLASLSEGRRFSEFKKSLLDSDPEAQLRAVAESGLLVQIHPMLGWNPEYLSLCIASANRNDSEPSLACMLAAANQRIELTRLCNFFSLNRKQRKELEQLSGAVGRTASGHQQPATKGE